MSLAATTSRPVPEPQSRSSASTDGRRFAAFPLRVLHIEVGGEYGGSTKALASFIHHSDRRVLQHEVLFWYPTSGADKFANFAEKVVFLNQSSERKLTSTSDLIRSVRRAAGRVRLIREANELLNFVRTLPFARRLSEIIASGAYDVVHVNNTFTYRGLSVIAARRVGCPVVASVKNLMEVTPLVKWLAKPISCVVTCNGHLEREVRSAQLGRSVRTIWDPLELEPPGFEAIARAREQLAPSGELLIGSVGRLDQQKGYEFLIRAAPRVIGRYPNVRFVILGEGPERGRLERLIEEMGLQQQFALPGFRTDVAPAVAAFDVFVCSSLWEGVPFSLVEAMLLERAVVSTDVGLASDVISPGGNGFIVGLRDSEALADSIMKLLSYPAERRREMGTAARAATLKFTDAERLAHELDEVIVGAALSARRERTGFVNTRAQKLPVVSIIIPTKNRARELRDLTVRLLFQTIVPAQIVIVDQSPDETGRVLVEGELAAAPRAIRRQITLTYIRDGSITGAANARNRGMDHARGDVWLFLDDDVLPEPEFMEKLLEAFANDSAVMGVSGVITNYLRPSRAFRLWTAIFARGPFHDERQPIYWNADNLRQQSAISVGKFGAGLMAFRANAVRKHRFDSNLTGVAPAEDIDFCTRLGDAKLVITPAARLTHRRSDVGRDDSYWLRLHAQASHYLYRRNWRSGLLNKIRFAWLNCGYALVASVASLKRLSLEPWRALMLGVREARRVSSISCAPPSETEQQEHELAN